MHVTSPRLRLAPSLTTCTRQISPSHRSPSHHLTISPTRPAPQRHAARGEGGAGRPGSRPSANDHSCGARRTPCPATPRRPPALDRPCHRPCGVSGEASPHPGPVPGARMVCPPTGLRYRTAAPGSCAGTRPCRRTAIPSPGRTHEITSAHGRHPQSEYIVNRNPLSPLAWGQTGQSSRV
jgi:hypothetical protein